MEERCQQGQVGPGSITSFKRLGSAAHLAVGLSVPTTYRHRSISAGPAPTDVVEVEFRSVIAQLASLGAVFFVHCGAPCNTFLAGRELDGGPRRSGPWA